MIDGLKPYPEYKDSGLPWLPRLPEHWKLRRLKTVFREVDDRSLSGTETLLSLRAVSGLVDHHAVGGKPIAPAALINFKRVWPGQIVMNRMRASTGLFAMPPKPGLVSPDYAVLAPRIHCSLEYFTQLFKSPIMGQIFRAESHGLGTGESGFLRLYYDSFGSIAAPFPPVPEQRTIVLFLDYANARFDRVLRSKRRELTLVGEIILNVTQQTLQSAGTRTLRLSTVAETVSRPIDRRARQSYTPIGLYNRGRGIFHKLTRNGSELGDSDFSWIENGDLVLSGQFAWEGAVALARANDSGCIASHRYPILRGRREYAISAMLLALFRTPYGAMLLDQHSRGAAGRNRPLNVSTLLKEKVPIPPLSKQAHIAELLDQEHSVAQALTRLVGLVTEYRTRLIADVVTGKIDVCEAAQRLPDIEEESESPAGPEELLEEGTEAIEA